MKKSMLILGIALFAFTGAFAQETQTETEDLNRDQETQELEDIENQEMEEDIYSEESATEEGKTKVTFQELPMAVQDAITQNGFEEIEVVEAYKVEGEANADVQLEGEQAEGEVGTEMVATTYEVHVQKEDKTKVLTFDESGEKIKSHKK